MNSAPGSIGVLLIQLGTPASPSVRDVRRYLREFLSDPRVIDLPAPARSLLLNTIILPFRPRRSAEAYEKIWTEAGSPLTLHTGALAGAVQSLLGDRYRVGYGMRYQDPPLADAIDRLLADGCSRLVLVPLFPQYASASTGSAIESALRAVAGRVNVPDVTTINSFADHPGFVAAVTAVAEPLLDEYQPDHVLFSYHGLPRKQLLDADSSGNRCLRSDDCCGEITTSNRSCYRAQCFATTRAVAAALGIEAEDYTIAFQSRLAGQKWIEPHTDKELPKLYARGIRRLAVLTPSFTADCLETIEEIGIRGRQQWEGLGGEMLLVPCVNAEPEWAAALAAMIREAAPGD